MSVRDGWGDALEVILLLHASEGISPLGAENALLIPHVAVITLGMGPSSKEG